ncbi:MAG: hypothetical protein Kow0080_24390 [Candidatus Promineifilaceae bacterium]
MAEASTKIILRRPHQNDETFTLQEGITTIGRSEQNDIAIADPEVSRRHAHITFQNGAFLLEDLGSTNGTFVNGRRLNTPTPLKDGDIIYLGETIQLDFIIVDPDALPSYEQATLYDQQIDTPFLEPLSPQATEPLPDLDDIQSDQPDATEILGMPPALADNGRRKWIIGCGCLPLILILLCIGVFLFLDAYQQGRLLYCGGLRPIFELILGPFGFAPICP